LSWLELSPEEALNGIRQVVAQAVADLEAGQETVPEPIAIKKIQWKIHGYGYRQSCIGI